MEYTQWAIAACDPRLKKIGLNPCCNGIYSMRLAELRFDIVKDVLILVVMEYTQWEFISIDLKHANYSLNPCCNGIYSMRITRQAAATDGNSLNPCCNGIYSMSLC